MYDGDDGEIEVDDIDDINIGETISCKNSNQLPSNEVDCETKSNIKQPRYIMFRC